MNHQEKLYINRPRVKSTAHGLNQAIKVAYATGSDLTERKIICAAEFTVRQASGTAQKFDQWQEQTSLAGICLETC